MTERELRPCIVKIEKQQNRNSRQCRIVETETHKGYFHKWDNEAYVVNGYLAGTTAGQMSTMYGIVEYEDGTVHRVLPECISFVDNDINENKEKKTVTENEALEVLKTHNEKCSGCDKLCNDLCKPAVEVAIKALKEIQQYRAIGTVEECQDARERQMAKNGTEKILIDYIISNMHWCPFKDETDNNFDNECVGFGEVGCGECILRHLDKLNR